MTDAAPLHEHHAWHGKPYRHADYNAVRELMRFILRTMAWRVLVRIESVEGLENMPPSGGAILAINHIAFVDPIVVLGVVQRVIVPMAKVEVYEYPIIGVLPRLYGVIPVRRGEFDRRALDMAQEVIRAGEIVLVAPEGTRSPAMQQGKEGLAFLAARTDAPIIPVGVDGTVGYPSLNPRRWRQGGAKVKIGMPFRYRPSEGRMTRQRLRQMTDEAMYRVAELLPPARRGVYANLADVHYETIEPLQRAWLAS
jgi:1-acyl-sn-glycerol-3-phosphate acyltransferase